MRLFFHKETLTLPCDSLTAELSTSLQPPKHSHSGHHNRRINMKVPLTISESMIKGSLYCRGLGISNIIFLFPFLIIQVISSQ